MNEPLPNFIAFGEALTDMIRSGHDLWRARPGGAPWNMARVVATLGQASAFAGAIGRDCFGTAIEDASRAAGLDLRFLQHNHHAPLLAIVPETQPPRYFFIGQHSADLHFDPRELPHGWQKAVRWAHFGGISLAREPLSTRLIAIAEELKEAGVRISYDPNWRSNMDSSYDQTVRHLCRLADVIKVSDDDLAGLYRTQDIEAAFSTLRGHNRAATVLHTHGARGASLHVGSKHWHAHPPQIDVIDTIGAGDACLGGLIASMMTSPDAEWPEHLRAAVATGTAACLIAGAGLPEMPVIRQLHDRVIAD